MSLFGEHDPGGKVRLRLLPGVTGSAEFSPCGKYRYWLRRDWDATKPVFMWVGMNPSTAEADVDDPTIRKEQSFTRREGGGAYIKVNVMDYRATHPRDLLAPGVMPCSDENDGHIVRLADAHGAWIVAAWGALPKALRGYAMLARAALAGRALWCMGLTKDGSPRHPLYLRSDAWMRPYDLRIEHGRA